MATQTISVTNDIGSVAGAIQNYITKKSMALEFKSYDTPLANSDLGIAAEPIPKSGGQVAEYRYFDNFEPTSESGNDSPLTYAENGENDTGKSLQGNVKRIPLVTISDSIDWGPLLAATDKVDVVSKGTQAMFDLIKRYVHRITNDRFVRQGTDQNSFTANWATANLAGAFKTIYAGGLTEFSQLEEGSLHNWATIVRARSLMRNGNVPTFANGAYKCIVSNPIITQLIDEDSKFGDVVKRHQDTAKTVFERNQLPMYRGVMFVEQDDQYRCHLPSAGGALTTRKNAGLVDIAHMLGRNSFAYVDLAGKNRLAPKLKTQDITVTGVKMTSGFRIPFNAGVIRNFGLNIAGTTEYFESIEDIAS